MQRWPKTQQSLQQAIAQSATLSFLVSHLVLFIAEKQQSTYPFIPVRQKVGKGSQDLILTTDERIETQ